MTNRCKGGHSLVEDTAHYITHNKQTENTLFFYFDSNTQYNIMIFLSTIVRSSNILHSEPGAAGMFLYPTTSHLTYSICPFAYINFDEANLCNLNQWNNHWLGLKETQYGSVTFLWRPRGLFVLRGARVPPPLPLMPRQGLMGTSVISNSGPVNTNSSVYHHNLLCCLWPLPRVRAAALPASSAWGYEGLSPPLELKTGLRVGVWRS